jgi:hypothetical protein
MIAQLLGGWEIALQPPPRLDAERPLPATLDHVSLRFAMAG